MQLPGLFHHPYGHLAQTWLLPGYNIVQFNPGIYTMYNKKCFALFLSGNIFSHIPVITIFLLEWWLTLKQ